MSDIAIRGPENIYQIEVPIKNGTFHGRWHFAFERYYDARFLHFGTLRVFNDDILSPGAVWPLHSHLNVEIVTYCAEGEFRHADDRGPGGILEKGWVQRTTIGSSMMHSEINNRPDIPMRFIQMWFLPSEHGLEPSVELKAVDKMQRTNRLLPLVSNSDGDALSIHSDAEVYSSFLEKGHTVLHKIKDWRGVYLYVVEGGPVVVKENKVEALTALMITGETELSIYALADAELLLVDVLMVYQEPKQFI